MQSVNDQCYSVGSLVFVLHLSGKPLRMPMMQQSAARPLHDKHLRGLGFREPALINRERKFCEC